MQLKTYVMDKQIYKQIQEDFVSNHHGTSLWVVLTILLHFPILTYLRVLLIPFLSSINSYFHQNPDKISRKCHNILMYSMQLINKHEIIVDMIIVCLPLIYFVTIYSDSNTTTYYKDVQDMETNYSKELILQNGYSVYLYDILKMNLIGIYNPYSLSLCILCFLCSMEILCIYIINQMVYVDTDNSLESSKEKESHRTTNISLMDMCCNIKMKPYCGTFTAQCLELWTKNVLERANETENEEETKVQSVDTDEKLLFKMPMLPLFTYYKGGVMLLTCIAILAVDFNIFPRYFAKTESFGCSLMDIGVGMFICSSALTSSYSRGAVVSPSIVQKTVGFTMNYIFVLLLGIGRLFLLQFVFPHYQHHQSEYGLHWNFFVTLFVIWTTSDGIEYCLDRIYQSYNQRVHSHPFLHCCIVHMYSHHKCYFGVLLMLFYQHMLSPHGMNDFNSQYSIDSKSLLDPCPNYTLYIHNQCAMDSNNIYSNGNIELSNSSALLTTTGISTTSNSSNSMDANNIYGLFQRFVFLNKEGVYSCLGYLSLYWITEYISRTVLIQEYHMYFKHFISCCREWQYNNNVETPTEQKQRDETKKTRSTKFVKIDSISRKVLNEFKYTRQYCLLKKMVFLCCILWFCYNLCVNYVQLPSRRLCNAGYVLYVLLLSMSLLVIVHLLVDGIDLVFVKHKTVWDKTRENPYVESFQCIPSSFYYILPLFDLVNKQQIYVFLFANVCTGVINMSVYTIYCSPLVAFLILVCYMVLIVVFASFIRKHMQKH